MLKPSTPPRPSLDRPASSGQPTGVDGQALDWFVRRENGLDAVEEARFQAWLTAHPQHAAAFARWQGDWSALGKLPADGLARLRHNLAAELSAEMTINQARRRPTGAARTRWWLLAGVKSCSAVAAALIVICGSGYLAWQHEQQQPVYVQSFATERGQQRDVTLPDGSQLRLDTATHADVAFYRQRREVRLTEGQVVFKVQADTNRPFDVLAGPLHITVVGTRFSTRYTPGIPGEEGARVAVEEGRVRVSGRDTRASALEGGATAASGAIELVAGQQVAVDVAGGLGAVQAISSAGIAPWRQGRVSFDNTPLAQALAEFSRYGNAELVIGDEKAAALRLTGTFDPRKLDNFRRVLPQVLPVALRKSEGNPGMTEIVTVH